MFGLGMWEIVVILLVAIVVLGPRRLPELARNLGRALQEFRRAMNDLKAGLEEDLAEPVSAKKSTLPKIETPIESVEHNAPATTGEAT
jgi:sec-independent protein translocase protein TatB